MFNKFKHMLQDDGFFYGFLILLIAIISFGLGRLSDRDLLQKSQDNTVSFTEKPVVTQEIQDSVNDVAEGEVKGEAATLETAQTYVASRSGQKYHLPWCPGAQQIKEENKIYFATKKEAEKAGYTPAANCQGI